MSENVVNDIDGRTTGFVNTTAVNDVEEIDRRNLRVENDLELQRNSCSASCSFKEFNAQNCGNITTIQPEDDARNNKLSDICSDTSEKYVNASIKCTEISDVISFEDNDDRLKSNKLVGDSPSVGDSLDGKSIDNDLIKHGRINTTDQKTVDIMSSEGRLEGEDVSDNVESDDETQPMLASHDSTSSQNNSDVNIRHGFSLGSIEGILERLAFLKKSKSNYIEAVTVSKI